MLEQSIEGAPHSLPLPTWKSEPFISYAQNAEDVMLYRALRGVERGFYVDVGAAEPKADSVTYAFYERGWRGINIEPATEAFKRLSSARPGDINLNLAAGDQEGTIPFFLIDGEGGLSTAIPAQRTKLVEAGWQSSEICVSVRTLTSILGEHAPAVIHFLKIDTEGSERAVIAGADLRRFRPWIITVESTAANSQVPTHHNWENLLLEANYRFAWFDGLNRFYISAEKADLCSAFTVQPNVFDNFVRSGESDALAQLDEARASVIVLSEQVIALQKDVDLLTSERTLHLRDNELLTAQLSMRENDRAEALAQLDEARASVIVLHEQLIALQKQTDLLTSERMVHLRDNELLMEQLSISENDRAERLIAIEALQVENRNHLMALEVGENERKARQERISRLTDALIRLQRELKYREAGS